MSDAQSLKEEGNALFRAGKLPQAVDMYTKAEQADPNNFVYPSNLSAALYEAADYAGCLKAVLRSWNLLKFDPSPRPDLTVRLSTRLAKALCNGVRSGVISSELLEEHTASVQDLEQVTVDLPSTSSSATSLAELARVWQEWRQLGLPDSEGSAEALKKYSELPKSIPRFDTTPEFYSIGHDHVIDILKGWGPSDPEPLELDKLHPSRLPNIAILFGGVGDARHVYGSLIGFHQAYLALSKAKRSKLHIHMTLLDIHPAALARDLCVLMLVNQLNGRDVTSVEKTEIQATIMYTFAAVVMPSYCFERLKHIIQDLVSRLSERPARVPSWLHVVPESTPQIIAALNYWDGLVKPVSHTLQKHYYIGDKEADVIMAPAWMKTFQNGRKEDQCKIVSKAIRATPDRGLPGAFGIPPNLSPKEARKFMNENLDDLADKAFTSMDQLVMRALEHRWYEKTKVFLPPSELIKRHPGFETHKQLFEEGGLSGDAMTKIMSHIHRSWRTNVTLFDDGFNNHPHWCLRGWPTFEDDPFVTFGVLEVFNDKLHEDNDKRISRIDRKSYAASSTIFEGVAEALNALDGRVKLEVLCGDITEELHKMQLKVDHARPTEFPRTYTRMWLSNVPDYTHGPMNTALYIVPSLQREPGSAVACNCLLNTSAWSGGDEYCHTYTLLLPEDLPRYLGCRVTQKDVFFGVFTMSTLPLPLPLSKLATREELTTWLTRVLLNIISPGRSQPAPHSIRLTNNLVVFFALLLHLHRVGFPGHWLSDFLRGILSGSLITDLDSYRGLYPIPVSELKRRIPSRRIRLDPWLAEFETIIAIANKGVPFSVTLPQDFASNVSDIVTLEASVKPIRIFTNVGGDMSPFMPVARLLFYKPGEGDAATIITGLHSVIEGKRGPPSGQLSILTAPELVNYSDRIVWKMSKKRVEKMREEKWEMAAYRIDRPVIATFPVKASKWRELS